MPIAVIDRPPDSFRALSSVAAKTLAPYRLDEQDAGILADRQAPAWVFLTGLKSDLSSTRNQEPGRQAGNPHDTFMYTVAKFARGELEDWKPLTPHA